MILRIFQRAHGTVILLAVMVLVFSIGQRSFLTIPNLVNIAVQSSLLGLMTIGLMLTVITGNLDLSVGSIAALSGIVFAVLSGWSLWCAAIIAVLIGVAGGALNGILVSRFRFNSIVVTLGSMAFFEGLALWLSHGYPIAGEAEDFEMLGGGFLLYIPLPIVFFAIAATALHWTLSETPFGRDIYAIGSNIELAHLSDIPVASRIFAVYLLSSLFSAFAGIVLASRLNTASPLVGQEAPLQALVAIVLGGTRLSGGQGGVANTVLGLLIVSILGNGLNLWNISPANRWGLTGALLITFAMLDRGRQRSRFVQETA